MYLSSNTFRSAWLTIVGLAIMSLSCISDESVFTQDRLEALCDQSLPMCSTQGSCVLDETTYVRNIFPGGFRSIVRNDFDEETLVVRILLTETIAPGTELHVELQSSDCGQIEEERIADVDLFEESGSDRTFTFELDFHDDGDHLLSVFSDMNAEYLLSVQPE